jgi:carbonic anhydrase
MIEHLFKKNTIWAEQRLKEDADFFNRLLAQQSPRYLWIGCSDSRVPANQIVGLAPGEVFVHRNVANVVHSSDINVLSVLEFAVKELKVRHIIVCGHYGCGGVRAVIRGQRGGMVGHWISPIAEIYARNRYNIDALSSEEERIDALCELNVVAQVERVAATPILMEAWQLEQDVSVHGFVYGLKDGRLHNLNVSKHRPHQGSKIEDKTEKA